MADEAAPPDATPLKGFPWGKLWVLLGALLTLAANNVVNVYQHRASKEAAVKEAEANTKAEVKTVTPATNATVEEVKQLKQLVAELAVEQQRQRERDAVRRKKARGTADTAKVKGAQDDASATLKAIKVKALAPNPALAPVLEAPTKQAPTAAPDAKTAP